MQGCFPSSRRLHGWRGYGDPEYVSMCSGTMQEEIYLRDYSGIARWYRWQCRDLVIRGRNVLVMETMEILKLPSKYSTHKIKANRSPSTVRRSAFAVLYYMEYLREKELEMKDGSMLSNLKKFQDAGFRKEQGVGM